MLPCPGTLVSLISPLRSIASSRLIARPRPVPPYFRDVPASACWKASKISFCFSAAIPVPGILYGESDHVLDLAEQGMIDDPALSHQVDPQLDVASSRELDRVRQKILQDLLKTLRVALDAMRKPLGELHPEREVLGLGHVPESAVDIIAQTIEGYLLNFERHRTRLNLRQIQYVVDQMQQVRP